MRDIVIKMKPQCFEDIIALVALYRPGPLGSGMVDDFIKRKKGATKITYELPALEPILKETYGVIVYQEQVMQIARTLAGYSLGGADLLRRSMGKKDPEVMELESRERGALRILSTFIRLSESLDRSHTALIQHVKFSRVDENGIHLEVVARGDCQLEIWGVEAEKKAFEKIFGKQLVIERIQTA
jgi:hypothetical protein